MYSLNQQDFLKLVKFVHQNYGIDLKNKKQLIEGRLSSTLASKGYSEFESYIDFITKTNDKAELDNLLNKLTTNYTFFLREKNHFDFLKNTILPQLAKTKKDKSINIWSAGCSSGEEPYTLSMILKDYFRSDKNWDTRVLATDISQTVLANAKSGVYLEDSLQNIPDHWKKDYFIKHSNNKYEVTPEIKSNVIFRTFNLMDQPKFKVEFDIIFCRNVMIYFDQETKNNLVNRFYAASSDKAYLMIGHSETITRETTKYKYIMPATYQK